jgi:purine-nucleoside phosphorylase
MQQMDYLVKIQNAFQHLKSKITLIPEIGIVLGSGLGDLANSIEKPINIPFSEIPHFPVSTVEGHDGKLIFGTLAGKSVMVLKGRVHYYEGYSMKEITFPIRIMQAFGIKKLILTNACGGLNPELNVGDLVLIKDHINLIGDSPLRGKNYDTLGPRFPDLSKSYDPQLIEIAENVANQQGIKLPKGIYAIVSGPCYETEAEANFLRIIGADTVGMSTVPECIIANHAGIKVLGISCVTDISPPNATEQITHEMVMETALKVQPVFVKLIKNIVTQL